MSRLKLAFAFLIAGAGAWAQFTPPAGGGGGGSSPAGATVTFSATPVFTCTSPLQYFTITLTGNVTSSTLSGCAGSSAAPYELHFNIVQGAGGPWTFAWPTGFSRAATIQNIATAQTYQAFKWDGSNAYPFVGTDTGPSTCPEQAAPSGNPASGFMYLWCDSTDHQFEVRNAAGTTIKLSAVGGLTVGQAVSGGGVNRMVYEDGSQNVATDSAFTFDGTTLTVKAGTSASAPSIMLGSSPSCGLWSANHTGVTPYSFDVVCNGFTVMSFISNVGLELGGGGQFCWGSAGLPSSCDTYMIRNAAKVIGLGTNGNDGWLNLAGQTRVTTQFDKTSSTALANVTGLSSTLIAGRKYSFRAELFTSSNVAGGVQVAIAGTATATSIVYDGFTVDAAAIAAQTRATALGTAVGASTAVTAAHITVTGTIVCNAAGTLTVQFAQNASNPSASSVLVNSTFDVWDWAN